MRNIQEKFNGIQSISEYISDQMEPNVNEGLKDVFKAVKDKFKKAWEYMKGIVVKVGSYILPVNDKGEVIPAITPLTAGQAYADGMINRASTFVKMDKEGAKITGCRTSFDQALKLYGPFAKGNSLKYFRSIKESAELNPDNIVNEVRLQNQDPEAKYNVVVDNEKLKKRVKMAIKNKALAQLMIWGAPGIGKTAILMGVLEEMKADFPDYQLIVKTLSNETPDNFTLPKYVEVDGTTKAEDVPKTWLPVYKPCEDAAENAIRDAKCGNGLLFIDELSRATPQVLNVILPLINERIINGYKLGSGWTIIVASNRAEDETSGQTDIGNALGNRFAQIYYEPTVDTWRQWAEKQNFISPLLLSWLSMPAGENMSGGKYYYMDPNEDMDGAGVTKLMCTPRAWTNAMRELAGYAHTGTLEGFTIFDIDTDILAMTLNQYVPAQAVDAFIAFLSTVEKIGDFDRAVHDIWKNGGSNFKLDKKDLNKICIPIAQLVCSAHSDALPSEKEFESLCEWLIAQKSDQLCSYTLDVFKNVFLTTNNIQDSKRDHLFFLKAKLNKLGSDNSQVVLYTDTFKEFFDKWGLTVDTLPDYSAALRKLGNTYKEAFKAAIVDGVEALG
jgi:hypothetical protein